MLDTNDIFYEYRLVLDTRLHLAAVLRGQFSEPFFVNMCKIAYRKIYLGYTNPLGEKSEMYSIMGFFRNRSHGLGIIEIAEFCAKMRMVAIHDKSKKQYAVRFLEWLSRQDEYFTYPQEVYEYKRLISLANRSELGIKRKKYIYRAVSIINFLYKAHPEVLADIGFDRKHKNIFEVGKLYDFQTSRQTFKQLRIFKNQTTYQTQQTAECLYRELGTYQSKVLVSRIIELLKKNA